ncbi:DNA cytosine methyltransferase [Herpetosiphon sp. NSE202]|uniref:DNA cytosine methyltransferase n=1 Tax=Herpetosiphon sp. NSE202 TaxID=3351349 RepID=UPI00362FD20D
MLRFISFFAGIGGFDRALEAMGMYCVAQVEIDPYATCVLETHWPDVPRYRDIRRVGRHNLPPCEVLAGGFPCQPHSLAGSRLAGADERDLWGEFARLIREIRPRYVLAENVPGLRSSAGGRFFTTVLRDLAQAGYDAEWQSLSASAVGAYHKRERLWIVAYPNRKHGWS